MTVRLLLIGTASTLSAQLAALQSQGLVPSGPPIIPDDLIRDICSGEYLGPLPVSENVKWDGRKS